MLCFNYIYAFSELNVIKSQKKLSLNTWQEKCKMKNELIMHNFFNKRTIKTL